MSTREKLRHLVESLSEQQAERALSVLEHMDDVDDEPLSPEELRELEAGFEDQRQGRVIPWNELRR
ncbi:MAG: hypothetical protein MUC42_11190 [Bryobacter sp.]|nr:hypothetical protein [Bryobacter sp.]